MTKKEALSRLRAIARKRGGKLLSSRYKNNRTSNRFKCRHGHTWSAKSRNIFVGHWCPHCANSTDKHFEKIKAIIHKHGGTCLSKRYKNCRTKIHIKCKHGHSWKTIPKLLSKGCWCPVCAAMDPAGHLAKLQQVAQSRGGQCLSKRYRGRNKKLRFSCKHGHIWSVTPEHIRCGTWCPKCRRPKRISLLDIRALAILRGGKCLAKKLPNANVKLQFVCKAGHHFELAAGKMKKGRWCPACAGVAKRSIGELRRIAIARGGRCLSKRYVSNRMKLRWECKKRHRWRARADSVSRGSWCPHCDAESRKHRSTCRKTIEEMQAVAKAHGGACLSSEYVNNKTLLSWVCKNGHIWNAAPARICRGTWCPHCAHRAPLTIEEMQKLARKRDSQGRCISAAYVNNHTHLTWKCGKGHVWKAQPMHIKNGTWCPKCASAPKPYC